MKLLTAHQWLYEHSAGRIGHRLLGVPCLLLYSTGAKSGQRRTNALTYARDGQDFVVVASAGGAPRSPGWFHNVVAKPDNEILLGTRRMSVTARAVRSGDPDYDRLWRLVNAGNSNRYDGYQRNTTRPIPLVVLAP